MYGILALTLYALFLQNLFKNLPPHRFFKTFFFVPVLTYPFLRLRLPRIYRDELNFSSRICVYVCMYIICNFHVPSKSPPLAHM